MRSRRCASGELRRGGAVEVEPAIRLDYVTSSPLARTRRCCMSLSNSSSSVKASCTCWVVGGCSSPSTSPKRLMGDYGEVGELGVLGGCSPVSASTSGGTRAGGKMQWRTMATLARRFTWGIGWAGEGLVAVAGWTVRHRIGNLRSGLG